VFGKLDFYFYFYCIDKYDNIKKSKSHKRTNLKFNSKKKFESLVNKDIIMLYVHCIALFNCIYTVFFFDEIKLSGKMVKYQSIHFDEFKSI